MDKIIKFTTAGAAKILIACILTCAAILNLQFLDCPNVNYTLSGHDEYIAVREVYTILNPLSYKHFFMAIISGDVLYYGRVMFYTDAIFAYIPYKIFGLQGLVYTIRMVHVIFVLCGLMVLAHTFIRGKGYRVLFYLGTATLYYSAYFFMVPKPEPIQFMVLALFFYFFKKRAYNFGSHFILLGLAYGIKFNVLAVLPLLFIIPLINNANGIWPAVKRMSIAIFYFLAGLIIAIPCLILVPLKPVFLKTYLNATFASTSHYDDDKSLNIMEWVTRGWFGAYNGGTVFGIMIIFLMLPVCYYGVRDFLRTRKVGIELILLLTGFCLFIPVILFTGRLWPHYLWTGYIFFYIAIIVFMQQQLSGNTFRVVYGCLFAVVLAGSLKCSYTQGKALFTLEENAESLLANGRQAYDYLRFRKKTFTAVQELSVPYPLGDMLRANPYHPFSTPRKDTLQQKFTWESFITPDIIERNHADYILTNKIDFLDSVEHVKTAKDLELNNNSRLMRNEFGRTVFYDSAFGNIRVYRVLSTLTTKE